MRDVATFAELMNKYHQWLRGENLWDLDELRATLLSPTTDPVSSDRYVELDGTSVAGIHTHIANPSDRAHLYLASPPTPDRLSHARMLLDAGLRLLRARRGVVPCTLVDIAIPAEDTELADVVRASGFEPARHVFILETDLATSGDPQWPSGYDVRPLDLDSEADVEASFAVFDEAFPSGQEGWRMEHDDYVHMVTSDPTAMAGLSTLVTDDQGVVGACLNFRDTTRPATGQIVMLGVVHRARSRGVGSALLLDAFARFRAVGWEYARLGTFAGRDSADLRLFESVGMGTLYRSDVFVRPLH